MVITLLPRGNRQGVVTTPSQVVDASVGLLVVQFDPHQNEMGGTKEVAFDVFASADSGATWQHRVGATAQGPWVTRPNFTVDPVPLWGLLVRAVITVPQTINCGVTLFVNEWPVD